MKLRENIAGSLVLAILTILVLLPLVTVLIQVVCPGLTLSELDLGNLNLVLDVFVRPLWKKAFINSATMSLCTTVLGLLLAGVLAHIRVKYDFPDDYAVLYSGPGLGLLRFRKRNRPFLAGHPGNEQFPVQLPRPGDGDGAV